jgi:hypothetical protein
MNQAIGAPLSAIERSLMTLVKSILVSAAFLVGTTLVANSQAQYRPNPYPQVTMTPPPPQVPAAPLSWYYNPYTSGLGPCPQRYPSDPPCGETIAPSYGQPSYWSR